MGFDLTLQAFPDDCELLEAIRNNPVLAEILPFIDKLAPRVQPLDAEEMQANTAYQVLKLRKPGIELRRLEFMNREYDCLRYVIGKWFTHQNLPQIEHEIMYGSAMLHPEARLTQGIVVQFTPSPKVASYLNILESISIDKAWKMVSAEEMLQDHVYKAPSTFGAEYMSLLIESFEKMKTLYRQATQNGEGIVAMRD